MTVEAKDGTIQLHGRCGVEDAETLLELLRFGSNIVDLTACEALHGALLQLLMAARPTIIGDPPAFLQKWVVPLINRSDSHSSGPMS